MIDETILLSNVTRICVGDMFDKAAMMLPTVLKCPSLGCTRGHGRAWWRTPPLSEDIAMELMDFTELMLMANRSVGVMGRFVMVSRVSRST